MQLIPINDIQQMGVAISKSGLFGMKKPEEFVALALVAQAEGRHPAIVARDYHIINGRPTLKADAILARFQEAGGTVKWINLTDKEAVGEFTHPSGGTVKIDWNLDRAKTAGISGNPTWSKYPRSMLRARVISEGVRTVYPAVLCGVYTPEEVGDMDYKPAPVETLCEVVPETITPEQVQEILTLCDSRGLDPAEVLLKSKLKNGFVSCPLERFEGLMTFIEGLPSEIV
jgi:hypothetical protein